MKKLAVLIGINQYPALPELKYARQDAEAIEQALKQNYCFSDNEILLMTDEKPGLLKPFNKQVIEKRLEELANQELDLFIFGFWGHGLFRNGERFLCPMDVMNDQVEDLGLSFKQLQRLFSNIRAKNTCMILDCCQKSSDRGEADTLTEDDCSVMENCARDIVLRRKEIEPGFTSNIAILNSCKEGQCAYEWDNRKHGIFTAHLLDAMNQRIDSVAKIIGYISANVAKTALELGKYQTPYYKMEGDILLPTNTESAPLVTGDVFISFRHCNADMVAPVENELKRRGITYFIDRVGVNYGMEYSEALTKAIAACKVLLLFWTKEVKGSDDIVKEVVLALKLKKTVIPYKIGNFSEIDHQRLCYHIAHLSYYSVPQQTPETISELVNRIEQILKRKEATPIEDVAMLKPSSNYNEVNTVDNPLSSDNKEPQKNQKQPNLDDNSDIIPDIGVQSNSTINSNNTNTENLSQCVSKFSFKAIFIKSLWFIAWLIGIIIAIIGSMIFAFILEKIFSLIPYFNDMSGDIWFRTRSWIFYMSEIVSVLLVGLVMQWSCIFPKWFHDKSFPGINYGHFAAHIFWIFGFIFVVIGAVLEYYYSIEATPLGGEILWKIVLFYSFVTGFLWSREYAVYLSFLDRFSIDVSNRLPEHSHCVFVQAIACSVIGLIIAAIFVLETAIKFTGYLNIFIILCFLIPLRIVMRVILKRRYALYYKINYIEPQSFFTKILDFWNNKITSLNTNSNRNKKMSFIFISLIIALCSLLYYKYYYYDADYYYREANDEFNYKNDRTEYLEKAAKRGHIKAMCELGVIYKLQYEKHYKSFLEEDNGIYYPHKATVIIDLFKKAANKGYSPAQYQLGCCYHDGFGDDGYGVKKDLIEAFSWFKKAAAQNNPDAQFAMGLCYFRGDGVSVDFAEGVKWYQEAAKQGHRSAQTELGRIYAFGDGVSKDINTAIIWLEKAANQDDVYSQRLLGFFYLYGRDSVQKNPKVAVKWLQKAAEKGDAPAQNFLGDCYMNGNGTEVNKEEAVRWYQKSAEQGNAYAQCSLGKCFANGDGIETNEEEAVKWYRMSAEQNNIEAIFMLGVCYMNGKGVEINREEAVQWWTKAAVQGDATAQYNLGVCFYNGLGVKIDIDEAKRWYKKSADQGYEDAVEALKRIEN